MKNYYSDIAKKYHMGEKVSIDELDALIEAETREQEKDSVVLAEDRAEELL